MVLIYITGVTNIVYKLTTHTKKSSSTVQYLTDMGSVLYELRTKQYDSTDVSKIDNTNIKCAFVRWRSIIKIERGNKHE